MFNLERLASMEIKELTKKTREIRKLIQLVELIGWFLQKGMKK